MDIMVDEVDARAQLGITPAIVVLCWCVLLPSIVISLGVLVNITCLWKRTIRMAHAEATALAQQKQVDAARGAKTNQNCVAKMFSALQCVYDNLSYHTGIQGTWFYRMLWASEVIEVVFQILAVEVKGRWEVRREVEGA